MAVKAIGGLIGQVVFHSADFTERDFRIMFMQFPRGGRIDGLRLNACTLQFAL
jgi:hypothetical protein